MMTDQAWRRLFKTNGRGRRGEKIFFSSEDQIVLQDTNDSTLRINEKNFPTILMTPPSTSKKTTISDDDASPFCWQKLPEKNCDTIPDINDDDDDDISLSSSMKKVQSSDDDEDSTIETVMTAEGPENKKGESSDDSSNASTSTSKTSHGQAGTRN